MNIRIVGSSRSGTTVIENFLSTKLKILALGEVKNFLARGLTANEICSCGNRAHTCDFWSKVIASYQSGNIDVYELLPKDFIDSSKSPFHFFRLEKKFDVTCVVIRDPTSVMRSYRTLRLRTERGTGSRKYMRRLPRLASFLYWCINYLSVPILLGKGGRIRVIRYEDFCIGAGGVELVKALSHQISGNPSRLNDRQVNGLADTQRT